MTEIIEIMAADNTILNGYINRYSKNQEKVLIQIHGMTSNCFKKREATISKRVGEIGIDTICFNNRGSEIVKYIKKKKDGETIQELAGTAYEDIHDSYYDILGAINYAVSLGYTKIYLQGHSLGSTKIVYTYNRLKEENNEVLKYIKGIILLSLVDVTDFTEGADKEEYIKNLKFAEQKEQEGKILDMMPKECFVHSISVKTFLRYTKYNKDIDFAQYDKENYSFDKLNNIDTPLFMRWGNDHR